MTFISKCMEAKPKKKKCYDTGPQGEWGIDYKSVDVAKTNAYNEACDKWETFLEAKLKYLEALKDVAEKASEYLHFHGRARGDDGEVNEDMNPMVWIEGVAGRRTEIYEALQKLKSMEGE